MTPEPLAAPFPAADRAALRDLLTACVHGGASLGFLAPLPAAEADAYWRKIEDDLPGGARVLLVLRAAPGGTIVGAGQLALETRPNGRHRAEVQKLMVLPAHRRRGHAAALLRELERLAAAHGRTLLFLDTSEGPGGARRFYEAHGYTHCGGIPGYALDPDGTPADNAVFWKRTRG